ncbi:ABC transporter permease [Clostridium sp. B9]|uniref:ABC transporter permease n=1 Tax=Clostridium sp. B9 TaxID=3423224 RepID=UPI003D2EA02A
MELLRIEFLKLKRFNILLLASITSLPSIIVGISLYNLMKNKLGTDLIMESIFGLSSSIYVGMLLNLLIIYLVCIITKIENSNNGWRGLLILPEKRWKIYISKISVIFIAIGVSLISFLIFILLITLIMGGNINLSILINLFLVFLLIIPVATFLFVIARNFNTLIVPLVMGIFFLITGFFIAQSDYWVFVPWTYAIVGVSGVISNVQLLQVISISIILSAFILVGDLIKFTYCDLSN